VTSGNGYIDFGWDTFSEEEKLSKRAIELNNGRAAQFGILGLMVHELIIPLGYDPELPNHWPPCLSSLLILLVESPG
jgi:hypothetical protein